MTGTPPRFVGTYALGALLGRGGTSEVYAATGAGGDTVALKLLRAELASDDAASVAFVEEAARTRALAHPAIVRVLDVGRDRATGAWYVAMERIDGESLAARLAREPRLAGPTGHVPSRRGVARPAQPEDRERAVSSMLPEPTLRVLGAALADGLDAAHARGIVHRDIKPGNIMLRASDLAAPVIVDFGIAKSLGASSATVTSRRIGTVAYMAPEQLAEGLITPAVDVWALGVVLFEAATGRLPFERFEDGRCPQLVEPAPRARQLAAISPALDDVIARCLERDPGRRWRSMAELASALRGQADDRVTEDLDAGPGRSAVPPLRAPEPALFVGSPRGFGAQAELGRSVDAPRPSHARWPLLVALAGASVAAIVLVLASSRDRTEAPDRGGELAARAELQSSDRSSRNASDPVEAREEAGSAAAPPTPNRGSVEGEVDDVGAGSADTTGERGASRDANEAALEPAELDTPTPADPSKTAGVSRAAPVELVVRSTPAGAAVVVDGKRRGVTPARLRVRLPASIVVRRSGYRPARLRAERGGDHHLRLIPAPRTEQGPAPRETLD
jgi:serine/threonine protein kinase